MSRHEARARVRLTRRPSFAPAVAIAVSFIVLGGVLALSRFAPRESCTALGPDVIGRKVFDAPPCTVTSPVTSRDRTYLALLETSLGRIRVFLDPRVAPKSVENFVFLARAHFFDGTTFHRIDVASDHAVIQGGDPTGSGRGGPGYEYVEKAVGASIYPRGVVAMASRVDAPGVNGSQFFIVVRDWEALGPGPSTIPTETIFGFVPTNDPESFATLDRMIEVPLDGRRPRTPIVIHRVTIDETPRS